MAETITSHKRQIAVALLLLLALLVAIWAFGGGADDAELPASPPPEVPVLTLVSRDLPRTKVFEGFLASSEEVELRPRTSGQITAVLVREGSRVAAGQPVLRLDAAIQQARVDELAANLQRIRVALENAERDARRAERLLPSGAISQREAEDAISEAALLKADLAATDAALRAARIDRGYTVIRSPIAGRVGEIFVDRGNLVTPGEGGTLLTRIVATDRLEVAFDLPEDDYLGLRTDQPGTEAKVTLAALPEQETIARIDFTSPEIDRASGTVRIKAQVVSAPPGFLPGAFVRVEIPLSQAAPTLLVPEIAIGSDQDMRFVLIVDEDDVVQFRPVTLGMRVGDQRIVETGLAFGERVLIKGLVRPGMTVSPVAWRENAADREP